MAANPYRSSVNWDDATEHQQDTLMLMWASTIYVIVKNDDTDSLDDLLVKMLDLLITKHGGNDRLMEAIERLGMANGLGSPFRLNDDTESATTDEK